ncbi:MAG: cysteine desulfurase family protein [Christensenellales bacterium]|jgi:cysteine desulfurase
MGIYLDHAATTYTEKAVFEAMRPYFEEFFGNPSSQHGFGRAAEKAVMKARSQVAALIGADSSDIYFTAGGTESDNWAIKGVAEAAGSGHIITSAVEHHAVLDTCKYLQGRGFDVTYLPVDGKGRVNPDDVKKAIRGDTILISVMTANNETGTIMPIRETGQIAREHDILFHTDAVQAAGHIPLHVDELDVDLLSLSAHKFYGPKGVGTLYVRGGITLNKFIHGGGHEKDKRAGTLNTPGIVGMGAAAEIALRDMDKNAAHEQALVKRLSEALLQLPESRLNGDPDNRLPGHLNISFGGIEGEALLTYLDMEGIAISTGSACSSGSPKPSYVLLAMGLSIEEARGAVRITLGRENTEEQIDEVIEKITASVKRLQEFSPLFAQRRDKGSYV